MIDGLVDKVMDVRDQMDSEASISVCFRCNAGGPGAVANIELPCSMIL